MKRNGLALHIRLAEARNATAIASVLFEMNSTELLFLP
jgi:hypothetical protein